MLFKKKIMGDNIIKSIYKKDRIVRYSEFLFGIFIVAVAFNILVMPSKVVYGMNGVGVMLNNLYSLDASIIILIGSIILLILSFFLLGKEITARSVVGSLLMPLFIKLTEGFGSYISLTGAESLLIVVMGAVATGLGLGLVFKSGFSTGGTDILNQIVSKYFKMSIGKAMFFTDGIIVASSILVFGFVNFMYSIISLYIISLMTDKVILGISSAKAFYIITKNENEIKSFITEYLHHGVTILEARGGYTGNHEKVLMCVIPTKEYYIFKEGIHNIDPHAFFVVTDSYEYYGGA